MPNYLAMLAQLRPTCEGLFQFLYLMRRIFPGFNLTRISRYTASHFWQKIITMCFFHMWYMACGENCLANSNEQNLNSLIGEFHGNHKGKYFFLICDRWRVVKTIWQNQLNEQNLNSLIGSFIEITKATTVPCDNDDQNHRMNHLITII